MRDLRRERERLGLSREEVAAQTRIPLRYLVALEEGETGGLPAGPFLYGYRKQYETFLNLDDESLTAEDAATDSGLRPVLRPEEEPEAPAPARTVPVGRLVGGGFILTLAVALALKVGTLLVERVPAAPTAADLPTQRVEVRAIEPTKVTVKADGETLFSGTLQPGAAQTFEGRQRLEVEAADLTRVTVRHNGDRIEPLGSLTRGRRLVFIQDGE